MSLRRAAAGLLRIFHYPCRTAFYRTATNSQTNAAKMSFFSQNGSGDHTWKRQHGELVLWAFLSGQAALILGINVSRLSPVLAEDVSSDSSSENGTHGANITGLRRIEDGSVISNAHTSKWRIFTDTGRERFLQGKVEEAEYFFLSALQEAKEGFGERDPHVASACNNLAELYRVKKEFDKAEPLYLEAIKILEESFGPEDIRVGAALHNLGQFYLMQHKLEEARNCYERALKIKRRVLGDSHIDTSDTLYHLGMVLYLEGKEKDAEALILDSIRILEEAGMGESMICIKRLRQLAQMYVKSNRLEEAEKIQRKILHIMELAKGWSSLDTVVAAEALALTLQSLGNLGEAQELVERCLDARKILLPEDHIQIAANMLHIARVKLLISDRLRKTSIPEAIAELNKAEILLESSIRIARRVMHKLMILEGKHQNKGVPRETGEDANTALIILLQSLNSLALIEVNKQEFQGARDHLAIGEAENALWQCISDFKEFAIEKSISNSPQVKKKYLSCLKHLFSLISETITDDKQESRRATLQELKDEIKRVELELSLLQKGTRKK